MLCAVPYHVWFVLQAPGASLAPSPSWSTYTLESLNTYGNELLVIPDHCPSTKTCKPRSWYTLSGSESESESEHQLQHKPMQGVCPQHRACSPPQPPSIRIRSCCLTSWPTPPSFVQHKRISEPNFCRLCCRATAPPIEYVTGGPLTGTVPVDFEDFDTESVPELPEVNTAGDLATTNCCQSRSKHLAVLSLLLLANC